MLFFKILKRSIAIMTSFAEIDIYMYLDSFSNKKDVNKAYSFQSSSVVRSVGIVPYPLLLGLEEGAAMFRGLASKIYFGI